MWMRGGTSKGGLFLARDLPADPAERDALLLRIMGSPDPRQIDGMGGGDPLTSKVAVVSPSPDPDADIDYLFLQVAVDRPRVSADQTCGNMLAAVAPFAIERGLVPALRDHTMVRIRQCNAGGGIAIATVPTPQWSVAYAGDVAISGVPGTAAPIALSFPRSPELPMLPTGQASDRLNGIEATLIDAGMPVVVLAARDLGLAGDEPPAALDADAALGARIEALRRLAGPLMGLGDVSDRPVPKVALVSPPAAGGTLCVRQVSAGRAHRALGVLAGIGAAMATGLPGGPAARLARPPEGRDERLVRLEHPAGWLDCRLERDAQGRPVGASVVRTARKLMDGLVFA